MKKYILILISFMIVYRAYQIPTMMSYVEVNDHDLAAVGCYVRSDDGSPFFQYTSIFAANINGKEPNSPEIFFNPQTEDLIVRHYEKIQALQSKGIKVFITLLGNHFNAGWSCMTDDNSIIKFADDVVNMINKYNFDGVDVDDEYSTCSPNLISMKKITAAIKGHKNLNGKTVSIALWNDIHLFEDQGLVKNFDYGWEMSYSGPYDRLKPYADKGFDKKKLFLGLRFGEGNALSYLNVVQNYGGLMFYNVGNDGEASLSEFTKVIYGSNVTVKNRCKGESLNFLFK